MKGKGHFFLGIFLLMLIIASAQMALGGDTSANWTRTEVEEDGWSGFYNALAIDARNVRHMAYFDNKRQCVRYATDVSGSWTVEDVNHEGDGGSYVDLAVDQNNIVHLCYVNNQNDLIWVSGLPGEWEATIVCPNLGTYGGYCSLAVDSVGNPHLSFIFYHGGKRELRYARALNKQWKTETLIPFSTTMQTNSSIALGSDNSVHIACGSSDKRLYHLTNRTGTWMNTVVDSLGNGPFAYRVQIAVDKSGGAHLVYDQRSKNALRYATNKSGSWVTETLDTEGDSWNNPAIWIDAETHVHISHFDPAEKAIRYRCNTNGLWNTSIIEDEGKVGLETSIFGTRDGHVSVGYFLEGVPEGADNSVLCATMEDN
ncbi:MAG: hypothetical protein WA705_05905 [Candidatus Ozemobacteraceae bacterium]